MKVVTMPDQEMQAELDKGDVYRSEHGAYYLVHTERTGFLGDWHHVTPWSVRLCRQRHNEGGWCGDTIPSGWSKVAGE